MTDELRERLRKVYELVSRGATEGERQAAKLALDRLVEKFKLNPEELNDLDKKVYAWKWSWVLERMLMSRIVRFFVEDRSQGEYTAGHTKELRMKLTYLDYVTVDCAYEYFRRHMKAEWMRVCDPLVKRCRKPRTRRAKREQLEPIFFEQYVIKSKLIEQDKIKQVALADMNARDLKTMGVAMAVKGGQYNRQVVTAHQLPEAKASVDKGGQYQMF